VVAVRECALAQRGESAFERIVFACFGADVLAAYATALSAQTH